MIGEPRCSIRHCKHFLGIKQDGSVEATERPVCAAFPDGIPFDIAWGDNLHTTPHPGDRGIQFEADNQLHIVSLAQLPRM